MSLDANRDPEGHRIYPGQNTDRPLSDFDGNPYLGWTVKEPSESECSSVG